VSTRLEELAVFQFLKRTDGPLASSRHWPGGRDNAVSIPQADRRPFSLMRTTSLMRRMTSFNSSSGQTAF